MSKKHNRYNDMIRDTMDITEFMAKFEYLTVKGRANGAVTRSELLSVFLDDGDIALLLKKYDPELYQNEVIG